MNKFVILLTVVAIGFAVAVNPVVAHENATGVVKERMMAMKAIGDSMKQLAALMKGKSPYDPDQVKKNALVIKKHSGENLVKLFPKGSGHKPSEARPEIWQKWDDFGAMAERLSKTADALVITADKHSAHVKKSGMMKDGTDGTKADQATVQTTGQVFSMPPPMPSVALFKDLAKTCKSCHTTYRKKT
jgi:cytochrome c556